MNSSPPRALLLLALGSPVGCAAEALPPPRPADALAGCLEERQSEDVTAWTCGPLTVVETLVLDASPEDVALAFDGFARNFGGVAPKRLDSTYAAGEARHKAVKLESMTESGEPTEAQMIAVAVGSGYRLVTCATKDARRPCGPVMASLVLELPRNQSQTTVTVQRPPNL